jgi:hypothetical protein
MASRPIKQVPRRIEWWKNIEEVRAARAAVAAELRRRPARYRRSKLTDEFPASVAEVYRQHTATGRPSDAVAKRFGYSTAYPRRVVGETRPRSFLGPALPGHGGERAKGEG